MNIFLKKKKKNFYEYPNQPSTSKFQPFYGMRSWSRVERLRGSTREKLVRVHRVLSCSHDSCQHCITLIETPSHLFQYFLPNWTCPFSAGPTTLVYSVTVFTSDLSLATNHVGCNVTTNPHSLPFKIFLCLPKRQSESSETHESYPNWRHILIGATNFFLN